MPYTFAVRDGETFVAVAKAYSGLSDSEIAKSRSLDPTKHASNASGLCVQCGQSWCSRSRSKASRRRLVTNLVLPCASRVSRAGVKTSRHKRRTRCRACASCSGGRRRRQLIFGLAPKPTQDSRRVTVSQKWIPAALKVSGFSRDEVLQFDEPADVMARLKSG